MISRREMLAIGGGMLLSSALPLGKVLAANHKPIYGGWLDIKSARQEFIRRTPQPYFYQHQSDIKGTGRDKEVMLWKYYEAITGGGFEPHFQDIGDCTGQACALGVDVLTTTQIGLQKKNEEWKGKCSTEAIYAGSRIEIGKGAACFDRRGRPSDGSVGTWVGEYVRDYGVLLRGKYKDIDLTKYDPKLARKWASSTEYGVPDELEKISKPHPVKTVTLVEGWEQACDLIANGYVVVVCSNVGFFYETDADGFLLRNTRDPWYHAMLLWGIDTKSKRQGGCFANSWGRAWVTGKKHRLGTPAGCFWADAKNIDEMLSQEDSIALSNYVGYPRQHLDYRLW